MLHPDKRHIRLSVTTCSSQSAAAQCTVMQISGKHRPGHTYITAAATYIHGMNLFFMIKLEHTYCRMICCLRHLFQGTQHLPRLQVLVSKLGLEVDGQSFHSQLMVG